MIAHILNPQNSLPFDVNYNHEHMYHLSLLVYYIALLLVTWYYCAMSCVHCTIIAVLSRELIFLFHWPPANHPRNHMPRCLESWFFLYSRMFTTKYDPRDRKTNVSLPWPTKKKKKKTITILGPCTTCTHWVQKEKELADSCTHIEGVEGLFEAVELG